MASPPAGSSLRGADLRQVDLSTRPLSGMDLRGADLRGTDLRGKDLSRAKLAGADLRGARLDGADLSGADLSDAELEGASLAGVKAEGADWRRSRAPGVDATGLVAPNGRWDGADWRRGRLGGADLDGARGPGWRLDAADLTRARLGHSRLERAVLDEATLEGTDLTEARLVEAALADVVGRPVVDRASFERADLRVDALDRFVAEGVRLAGAKLRTGEAARLLPALQELGWRPGVLERVAINAERARLERASRPAPTKSPGPATPGLKLPAPTLHSPPSAPLAEGPPPVAGPADPDTAAEAREAEGRRLADADAEARAEREAAARVERERAEEEAREAERRRRQEVEQRARAELRAMAVRRAVATRAATRKGIERLGALAQRLGSAAGTWRQAIVGRPEDDDAAAPEGGLDFPLRAEQRDQDWQGRQTLLDERWRGLARAARVEERARRKQEAEEAARREAEERARAEARARWEAEEAERLRREEERRQREEEERVRREAEEARRRAEEEERRRAELERQRVEAEERARREAEEAERRVEEARRRAEEEERRREEEEERRRAEEERLRREAEERARREVEERIRREAEERARLEAERRRAEEEERRRVEEARRREEEARVAALREVERQAALEAARLEAEARARREAEERARREAEEHARAEAEAAERARRLREEAEARARAEVDAWVRQEAEARRQREAVEAERQRREDERRRRDLAARERQEAERSARESAREKVLAERRRIADEARARREAEHRTREEARRAREEAAAAARAERELARAEERARARERRQRRLAAFRRWRDHHLARLLRAAQGALAVVRAGAEVGGRVAVALGSLGLRLARAGGRASAALGRGLARLVAAAEERDTVLLSERRAEFELDAGRRDLEGGRAQERAEDQARLLVAQARRAEQQARVREAKEVQAAERRRQRGEVAEARRQAREELRARRLAARQDAERARREAAWSAAEAAEAARREAAEEAWLAGESTEAAPTPPAWQRHLPTFVAAGRRVAAVGRRTGDGLWQLLGRAEDPDRARDGFDLADFEADARRRDEELARVTVDEDTRARRLVRERRAGTPARAPVRPVLDAEGGAVDEALLASLDRAERAESQAAAALAGAEGLLAAAERRLERARLDPVSPEEEARLGAAVAVAREERDAAAERARRAQAEVAWLAAEAHREAIAARERERRARREEETAARAARRDEATAARAARWEAVRSRAAGTLAALAARHLPTFHAAGRRISAVTRAAGTGLWQALSRAEGPDAALLELERQEFEADARRRDDELLQAALAEEARLRRLVRARRDEPETTRPTAPSPEAWGGAVDEALLGALDRAAQAEAAAAEALVAARTALAAAERRMERARLDPLGPEAEAALEAGVATARAARDEAFTRLTEAEAERGRLSAEAEREVRAERGRRARAQRDAVAAARAARWGERRRVVAAFVGGVAARHLPTVTAAGRRLGQATRSAGGGAWQLLSRAETPDAALLQEDRAQFEADAAARDAAVVDAAVAMEARIRRRVRGGGPARPERARRAAEVTLPVADPALLGALDRARREEEAALTALDAAEAALALSERRLERARAEGAADEALAGRTAAQLAASAARAEAAERVRRAQAEAAWLAAEAHRERVAERERRERARREELAAERAALWEARRERVATVAGRVGSTAGRAADAAFGVFFAAVDEAESGEARRARTEFEADAGQRDRRLATLAEARDDAARAGWRAERARQRRDAARRQRRDALAAAAGRGATALGEAASRASASSFTRTSGALQFVADGAWWLAMAISRASGAAAPAGIRRAPAALGARIRALGTALGAAGVAVLAWTGRQVPAAWRFLTGALEPEDLGPSASEMADFRREALSRDQEWAGRALDGESRARLRVRRVRRDAEAHRVALAAQAEAAARAAARGDRKAQRALEAARRRAAVQDAVGSRADGARAAGLGVVAVVARMGRGLWRSLLSAPPVAVGPGVDLRGQDLHDRDLSGADLRGADLAGARLVGVDLRGADLSDADLRGADLTAANLAGARLGGAHLAEAVFDLADLGGAELEGADVAGARLARARGLEAAQRARLARAGADVGAVVPADVTELRGLFTRLAGALRAAGALFARGGLLLARLGRGLGRVALALAGRRPLHLGPDADLDGATLHDRDLAGLDLRGARMNGAGLVGADLRGADLRGASLRGADLTAARLDGARLDGALLDDAILDQAELGGASLDGASVLRARLVSARGLHDLVRADLARRGADVGLPGADADTRPEAPRAPLAPVLAGRVLRGVRRIRDAIPTNEPLAVGPGADLRGRALDDRDLSQLNLQGAILAGAGLVGADLRGTDLRGADLRGADLTAAHLEGALLQGAFLENAVFDQAELTGAHFEDARVSGARLVTARGLTRDQRLDLSRRGADLGEAPDATWVRATSWGLAAALLISVGVYLGARYSGEDEQNRASVENLAGEAALAGNPAEAAARFEQLAKTAADNEQRVQFLLEAANAAQEAGDVARALESLAEAATFATDLPSFPQVLLRTAQVQAAAGLSEGALGSFRTLLERADLSPNQQAGGLIGLARLLPDEQQEEVARREASLLADADTDPQRAALGMALADGWAAAGRPDAARTALERALAAMVDPAEVVPMRIRLARIAADNGDVDGALAMFEELVRLPGGKGAEARLGAAELLSRRGAYEDAAAMLAPLARSADEDLRSRARLALANLAEQQGDTDAAVAALREVLGTDGIEPSITNDARLLLARILVRTDPAAAAALVGEAPELRDEVRLGQARALREDGKRADARVIWVEVSDDPLASPAAKMEASLSLAELEVEDNDPDAALRRYEALLANATAQSDRERIQLGAANALVRGGRLQEAEARYLAMLGAATGDVADQCRLGLARAAELRGQTERATELYTEVGRSQGPWALEALSSLGGMRERLGDYAGAVAAYRLAQARPAGELSRRNEVAIALARSLDESGDPAAAEAYAALLEAPDPAVRVAARIAVGESAVGADPGRARTLFAEALEETPAGEERQRARAGWVRASVALGDVTGGLEKANEWLGTEPDEGLRGELAVAAVRALRAEGRLDEALDIAVRYAKEGGFELGMERAGVLREAGRADEAAELVGGLEAASGEDEVWRTETEADALLAAGAWPAAADAYRRLQRLPGGEAAGSFGLARLAREKGDYDDALSLLSASDDPRAPVERATILEARGSLDEAEQVWRKLAADEALETRSAGVLGVARVALARDDAAGAIAALDTLPKVDPGYRLTWAQVRGDALLALGRVDEARTVYAGLTADAEARVVGALGLAECDLAADDAAGAVKRLEAAYDDTEDPYYQGRALAALVRANLEAGDRSAAEGWFSRLQSKLPDQGESIAEAKTALASP